MHFFQQEAADVSPAAEDEGRAVVTNSGRRDITGTTGTSGATSSVTSGATPAARQLEDIEPTVSTECRTRLLFVTAEYVSDV